MRHDMKATRHVLRLLAPLDDALVLGPLWRDGRFCGLGTVRDFRAALVGESIDPHAATPLAWAALRRRGQHHPLDTRPTQPGGPACG